MMAWQVAGLSVHSCFQAVAGRKKVAGSQPHPDPEGKERAGKWWGSKRKDVPYEFMMQVHT